MDQRAIFESQGMLKESQVKINEQEGGAFEFGAGRWIAKAETKTSIKRNECKEEASEYPAAAQHSMKC